MKTLTSASRNLRQDETERMFMERLRRDKHFMESVAPPGFSCLTENEMRIVARWFAEQVVV